MKDLRKIVLSRKSSRGRSFASSWIFLRKSIQILSLLLFFSFFISARWSESPLQRWVGLFFKIDPLVSIASWLYSIGNGVWQSVGRSLWLGLVIIGITFLAGRGWCGWICPTGTLLEWFTPRRKERLSEKQPDLPDGLRSVKYYLLFIILISALLGSLTWIIFDPITILERTISHSVWPALNWLVTRLEFMLYRFVPSTGAGLSAFDSSIRPALLPDVPVPRQAPFLFAMLFAALVSLNWLAPRFWCRYLCPLGGLLGIVSKVSVIRRTVFRGSNGRIEGDHDHRSDGHREHHKDCTACKLCSSSCPTGTIDPDRNFESDPAECTMCLACLDSCPRQSTSFKPVLNVAPRLDYDPDRRAALVSIGASVCGAALLSASWLHQRNQPFRLRPPGVVGDPENHGGDMPGCIRCGACLQACPTSGLQPALSEAGLEGLWTPVLVPRLGYCDYSCNACGQVCPVGAIPSLTLEAKRTQTIGKAYIDQDRCLAWADGVTCIVCEEMCPLPEKAITWDEGTAIHGREPVQRPVVNRDLCIGCGICEYKCPLPGKAAIQVEVV